MKMRAAYRIKMILMFIAMVALASCMGCKRVEKKDMTGYFILSVRAYYKEGSGDTIEAKVTSRENEFNFGTISPGKSSSSYACMVDFDAGIAVQWKNIGEKSPTYIAIFDTGPFAEFENNAALIYFTYDGKRGWQLQAFDSDKYLDAEPLFLIEASGCEVQDASN